MQLTILTFIVIVLMCIQEVKAQIGKIVYNNNDFSQKRDTTSIGTSTYIRSDWKKIELDFLSSYYSQDGNNSAVTGGIGTEQLTDFTQKISIAIPTSPKLKLNLDASYDYYSSASTDNIDDIPSSASQSDVRSQFNVGVQYQMNEQWSTGLRLGASTEYDYSSYNGGLNLSYLSKSGNSRLDLVAQAYIDSWKLYFPRELRREVSVPTTQRQSYNLAISYNQVLNKRMQLAILSEVVFMNGLLSTPFHRVYFNDQERATIEKLPGQRLKLPIGLRLNYHIAERLILRSYYRYYWDSWGMQGHTLNFELPIKINRFFAIYPHYRYHTQTAVDHFAGYKEQSSTNQYYTSDYDLSALSSHSYGFGLLYSRPNGLASVKVPFVKNRKLVLESVDLKGSIYQRSTGLKAYIISVGAKVSF